jgi:hypothetical protein
MTDLVRRALGGYNAISEFADPVLLAGGIAIDTDAYDASTDRIYDIKGIKDIYILIQNTHATNGLTYKVQQTRAEFTDISELVDGDFVDGFVAEANVAGLAEAESTTTRSSAEVTAIRIRFHRQTPSNDATLAGNVAVRV